MNQDTCVVDAQTLMTEITIQPDGRVFVFGASRQVLEALRLLQPRDRRLTRLFDFLHELRDGGDQHGR